MKGALLALLLFLSPPPLDRIVAVVDKSPILLSEIRALTRPIVKQQTAAGGSVTENEIADLERQMIDRVIDDRILEQEATRMRIEVSAEEVDKAIEAVADQQKAKPEEVFTEVERLGMTRQQYRDELRRQIVQAKWFNMAVRPRLREVPKDPQAYSDLVEKEKAKELAKLRPRHYIEVRR